MELLQLPNDWQTAIRTRLKRNVASVQEYYRSKELPVNAALVLGGCTCSVLHYLAGHGHAQELEHFCNLLPHDQSLFAAVNILSSEHKTPLHLAIAGNHLDCIKVLISHGASLWLKTRVDNGFKQLMAAVDLAHVSGHLKVESFLRKVEVQQEAAILTARKKLLVLWIWEKQHALPLSVVRHTLPFFSCNAIKRKY